MGGFAAMDREKSQPSCQDSILLYWVSKVGPGLPERFWGTQGNTKHRDLTLGNNLFT